MLDDKQFVEDCLRTESQVENITVDPELLAGAAMAFTSAGAILDQIKKHAFYGKAYNDAELRAECAAIIESLDSLKEGILNIEDKGREQKLGFNPRMFHSIVGIATESTELMDALFTDEDMDYVNVGEEYGDLGWYQAIGLDEMGMTLETSFTSVVAKLKERYSEKFSSDEAINRDVVAERIVLEDEQEQGC